METLELEQKATPAIVNVASVRHLSPFRYPGGKTWLVPRVLSEIRRLPSRPALMVDPFLGGGSVPLAALSEGYVDRLVLCEKDENVAAVWRTIFSQQHVQLCDLITSFRCEREYILELIERTPRTLLERAFQTIVRNRTFRGGILASGASLVKTGENGRGVASRWYPETLVKRIRFLATLCARITFVAGDGIPLLQEYAQDEDAFIFIDPPYTAGKGKRAGSRLYRCSEVDHDLIFSTLEGGCASFMMTYDDDLTVLQMAHRSGFVLEHVPMKNTHHQCMNELLVTRSFATSVSNFGTLQAAV